MSPIEILQHEEERIEANIKEYSNHVTKLENDLRLANEGLKKWIELKAKYHLAVHALYNDKEVTR